MQKVRNPDKASELKGQLERLEQQMAADAQQQRKDQLAARLKVWASGTRVPLLNLWQCLCAL